jgi:cobalt-zinc-cadmium efflux system protein
MLTGWMPIDPILSVVVALIILRSALFVVRDSGHILLEGAPPALDSRTIREDLKQTVPGVIDVHHVHVWSITQERPMITLHARVGAGKSPELLASQIKTRLRDRFHVAHATVEVEFDACADEQMAPGGHVPARLE